MHLIVTYIREDGFEHVFVYGRLYNIIMIMVAFNFAEIIIMVSSYIAHIQCSVRFTHITPGNWTCSFMYHFNSLFGAYNTCSHFGARN